MRTRSFRFVALMPMIGLIMPLLGAVGEPAQSENQLDRIDDEIAIERIAELLFPSLPESEQTKILAAEEFGVRADPSGVGEGIDPYTGQCSAREWLDGALDRMDEEAIGERRVDVLIGLAEAIDDGVHVPPLCFAPGTPDEYVWLIDQLHFAPNPNAFQQAARWQRTAISGPGLEQGDPTVITYSFVPDGTFIPDAGLGSGNSLLFAWLNSVYGSTEAWQSLFAQVFARWEELTGTSYVYEPNDDGATFLNFVGEVGIRGDVRIAAMLLDGNSGILAFNFFPDFGGDMVFDAFDSFYNSTGGNSLGLRNVIAHEHGHGLGMFHVCPVSQTKLMEPFVSFFFDGPQLDDTLNGQRHYGDPFEPNDLPSESTDFGSLDIDGSLILENASIDDPNDHDFYSLTLLSPTNVIFTATPAAGQYTQGPQTQSCNFGSFTDFNIIHDLVINVYSADNLLVPIQTASLGGVGEPEVMQFAAPIAGEYFFEVLSGSLTESVQRYRIDIESLTLLSITGQTPQFLEPGASNSFDVTMNTQDQPIEPGSEMLFYREGSGSIFESSPLIPTEDPMVFTATIPPFLCDPARAIEFYVQAATEGDEAIFSLPPAGGDDPLRALVGEVSAVFEDDFQLDLGWQVSGTVLGQASGEWERGVPAGDGTRGDPPADADGSGSCYVTGNGGPGTNTDVDGGETILTSPAFDISSFDSPSVSYWRWYDNTGSGFGSGASEDFFVVQVSDDGGGSWIGLELIGDDTIESRGGWIYVEFELREALSSEPGFDFETTDLRFRFIADDQINSSIIEAGVDGFSVRELVCQDPPAPSIGFSLITPPPFVLPPMVDHSFDLDIVVTNDTLVGGSGRLIYTDSEGSGESTPLVHNGGSSYTATLPALACQDGELFGPSTVLYTLEIEGVLSGVISFPSPEPFSVVIGEELAFVSESFESESGWTVDGFAGSAGEGRWERGVPIGDGSNGDPTEDWDGSGSCFVTGNLAGGAESDVDASTILISPVYDIGGLVEPRLRFAHWLNDGVPGGINTDNDILFVDFSVNGSPFVNFLPIGLSDIDETEGGWLVSDLAIEDHIFSEISTVQFRFTVFDILSDSIMEAGIDGVLIYDLRCVEQGQCLPDLGGNPDGSPDGVLNFADVSAFLTLFSMGDLAVDFAGHPDGSPDGLLNSVDLSRFLALFSAGCP